MVQEYDYTILCTLGRKIGELTSNGDPDGVLYLESSNPSLWRKIPIVTIFGSQWTIATTERGKREHNPSYLPMYIPAPSYLNGG